MKPERPIKGGYILISLGLVALTAGASLTLDYERITQTKKHIVLTGIKVADTIMPDLTVKPIFGNGTITFSDVYGYDIVVSSNGSASVSEHTSDIPNVEEAPIGEIVDALGLDEDGKVVKGSISGGTKLYRHHITGSDNENHTWEFYAIMLRQESLHIDDNLDLEVGNEIISISRELIGDKWGSAIGFSLHSGELAIEESIEKSSSLSLSQFSDTVTEL